MLFDLIPNGHPFNLQLSFKIAGVIKLTISVFEPNSMRLFARRKMLVGTSQSVLIKLPIVPDELRVKIEEEQDKHFVLEEIKVLPDTKCPVELTELDKHFIRFIKWFATRLETLQAGVKGTLYQSEGFNILYLDTIKEGNLELTTPARIARGNGIIEVSKKAIRDYTVPMLVVMFLHEYAHKFKNPQYGKEVENEITADIIAVHIALNLGFDALEVENCFKAVFAKKNTDLNRRRMGAIKEFIALFQSNEKERCSCKI